MTYTSIKSFSRLFLILVACSCKQGGTEVRKEVPGAKPVTAPSVGGAQAIDCNGVNAAKPECVNAKPGLMDVVVLVATNSVDPKQQAKLTSAIADLTKDLATGVGSGLRVSLIAKGAPGILQNPEGGLTPSNGKGVDYPLKPSDTLIAALIAGCPKANSTFPDVKVTQKPPTICGESLISVDGNTLDKLGQAQLAGLSSISESLVPFLRVGVTRVYVVLTDDDAQYMNGEVLTKIVQAQNGGKKSMLFALAPTSNGATGDCPATAKASEVYPDVTHDTGGNLFSFCDKQWENSLHAIVAAVVKMK